MMKKIILSVVSFLILIIAAALIVPSFIDWSQYKDQIKAQVAKGTGYDLELNGSLKASFFPFPQMTVNNVVIDSNGAPGPYAFRGAVEKASVSIALMPLLAGNIAVSDVTLIKPDLVVKGQKFEPTAEEVAAIEDAKSEPQESSVPAIQIEELNLENAKIAFTPLDGKTMMVEIPELSLEADTLYGPYEFDGAVIYNAMNIAFEGESGAYSKTETMPVNIKVSSDAYGLDFDGIVDTTKDEMSVQGETSVTAKSLSEFGVPLKGALSASGLLTASPSAAKLDNGVVTLGDAKAKLNLTASGLGDGQTKNIVADVAFSSAIDLDDIMGELSSSKKSNSNTKSDATAKTQSYAYLPQTIELPSNMVVNAAITAPAIQYKGKAIEGVSIKANVNGGTIKTSIKANKLPDGGALNMDATVKAESTSKNGANGSTILANPSLVFDGNVNVKSIKALATDWLGMVDAKTFDNPAVPNTLNGTLGGGISGATAKITAPKLQAGKYNITGLALSYINGATPKFDVSIADIDGAAVKLAGTAGNSKEFNVSLSHPNAARAIQIVKPEFKSTPTLTKPMNFNALVAMNDNTILVQNMTAKLGDISTKGSVNVNTASNKPDIKAELAFGKLDTQALMGGETSTGTPTSGSSSSASKSTGAPWTRDAIDTEFMRAMNIDIKATADTLVHGTWTINNPKLDIALKDGVLTVRDVTGGLFGGSVALNGKLSAPTAGQALDVNGSVKASDVDINKLFKAATTQTKDRVLGVASFNMDVSANGVSSSALVNSLNGDGQINTSELTINGLDLAKLSEAISDESLTDLKAAIDGMTNGGKTVFEPVSHKLTIREGTMSVDNLTLKNNTATLSSNGYVSFSRWMMDLKNVIQITEPEKLPELVMNIKGPLNNPSKNVASDLIRSYVMGKYGAKISDKVDKLLGDKLKDTPVKGLINNFLGVPNAEPKTETAPTTTTTEPQAEQQPAAKQPSVEEQAIKGLMGVFGK